MAKKAKHEEHENLERWLISYADFITLLFATFVVLYALSQVDIKDFKALEDSIKKAFSSPSIMQGDPGIMKDSSNAIFDTSSADSVIAPLMMEYMSQKYEESSYQEISKEINDMNKTGEMDGVEVMESDRGLIIRFKDNYLFKSGSAELMPKAKVKLDKIGVIIAKKFILHNMRVEGHTDNQSIHSIIYPSNWELSSARASSVITYLIRRFGFMPSLFTAVGFADTRPIADNTSPQGQAKNRRIEVLILRNRLNAQENPQNAFLKMSKGEQEKMQQTRYDTINRIQSISDKAKQEQEQKVVQKQNSIILNEVYEKELKRLNKETNAFDDQDREKITGQGDWLKPPAKNVWPGK